LRAAFRSDLGATAVNVYRGDDGTGAMRLIDTVVPQGERFEFADRSVAPGSTYRYQIGVVDPDGEFLSPVVHVTVSPLAGALSQNTPNPFNPTTTISYVLPAKGRAVLRVYAADGRLVRTLVDGVLDAGAHEMTWDGRDDRGRLVASGVYFYRLEAGRFQDAKKMVLLK
ncbi:MAG: T9SS type A sorting domain-containing protein, partial [Candidatus Krumholzibacteria bacterium]|nr:T9SS type A sorting domain-containing protein [Candidatus Krumholzibacteria bacterium]